MANIDYVLKPAQQVIKPVLFLIVCVVAYIVVNKIIKNWKTRNVGKSGGYNPSQLNKGFNYDNLADAIHETFDGWFLGGDVEGLSEKLMALNDDELKYVNDRYYSIYGKGTRSMYKAIDSVNFCFNCPNHSALLKRMSRLGLG